MSCSYRIICFIIFSTLISCKADKNNDNNTVPKFFYNLGSNNAVLQIENEGSDFYISIRDTSKGYKYLNAINGCGNCFIDLDSASVVQKVNLSTRKQQYIVVAGINGSTFGAKYLFIIWNDGTEWSITRAPFHRFEIRKNGNQDYIVNHDSSDEEVYHFENGQLLK